MLRKIKEYIYDVLIALVQVVSTKIFWIVFFLLVLLKMLMH